MVDLTSNFYRVGRHDSNKEPEPKKEREKIEPWLSAVFQSEHLSLLLGNGFTTSIACKCSSQAPSMDANLFYQEFGALEYIDKLKESVQQSAQKCGRGDPNCEDVIRVTNQLIHGLEIIEVEKSKNWQDKLNQTLCIFLKSILKTEQQIYEFLSNQLKPCTQSEQQSNNKKSTKPEDLIVSFLLSFASRAPSRGRLNLFTTNYDRLIEYGCDLAGLRIIDRFVGGLTPVFRSSRLDIDMHYNPPGIRGEPRYLEGVIRLFKLHGSIDWRFENNKLHKYSIPFGASEDYPNLIKSPTESVMIYPNAAKDVETTDYPYAELFRDFSASLCRPNSSIVTYGYGFGDDHINRVLADMLTIPSTHLVIISYDDPGNRISKFCDRIGHEAQISILFGKHYGDISNLVEHYLPKPAFDLISSREASLRERRQALPKEDEEQKQSGKNDNSN